MANLIVSASSSTVSHQHFTIAMCCIAQHFLVHFKFAKHIFYINIFSKYNEDIFKFLRLSPCLSMCQYELLAKLQSQHVYR